MTPHSQALSKQTAPRVASTGHSSLTDQLRGGSWTQGQHSCALEVDPDSAAPYPQQRKEKG